MKFPIEVPSPICIGIQIQTYSQIWLYEIELNEIHYMVQLNKKHYN